jgi:oxygen-dependent protoporphyrinogen oxidase
VKGAYIYWKGRFHPIPDGIQTGVPTKAKPVLASSLLSVAGKIALTKDFITPKGPSTDQSLGHFLRRRFGNQIVDRLAAPMLSGIYAGDIDQMSLQATFPYLQDAEQEFGSVYRGSRRRKVYPPNAYVQRYHSIFLSLDRGLQELITQLSSALRTASVHTGAAVTDIKPLDHNRWQLTSPLGTQEYDALVITTPAWSTAALLPFLPQAALDILRGIVYANLAVIGAAYKSEDVPMKTDKTGFLVPHQSGLRMTAVTWVSSKWHFPHTDPLFVLRAFYGRATENILDLDNEKLLQLYAREIQQTMGISKEPEYQTVFRVPHGMPQYLVGHLDRMEELHSLVKPWPTLFVLGAFEGGVGMPDRVRQAKTMVPKLGEVLGAVHNAPESSSQ